MIRLNVYTDGEVDMLKAVLNAVWHYDNLEFVTKVIEDADGITCTEMSIKGKNPTREGDIMKLISYALKIYTF